MSRSACIAAFISAGLLLFHDSGFCAEKKPKSGRTNNVSSGKPEVFEIQPRGVQRGTTNSFKLLGVNLMGLTELKFENAKLKGKVLDEKADTNVAWVQIVVPPDLVRGSYEFSVKNPTAESGKIKLQIDDLPQVFEASATNSHKTEQLIKLPASFWGIIDPPGETDEVLFEAASGASLVFDLAARRIGSKANIMLTLLNEQGSVLAANNGFDGSDPLLHFRIPSSGKYRIRIADRADAGSKDHFYRLSIGSFPFVTGHFPLGVPVEQENDIQLIGYNLPAPQTVRVKAKAAGEIGVPLGPEFRSRHDFKVVVTDQRELFEIEPNDTVANATPISIGTAINGRINPRDAGSADADVFSFEARASQALVIETDAAARGSPIDTKIEVLDSNGKPVERVLLQAVRDSHVTFRGIDSNTDDLRVENWQEMEFNQLMYLQGEVCKIFRMPQGPDSGFQFYSVGGKRRNYFDSSPVAHALDEPCYIVEPHPPGTSLLPNGLPTFHVYYANDDESERSLGTDSRILFTARQDGRYFVRVTDSRGLSGDRFVYRLVVRPAQPDFKVSLKETSFSVSAGAGTQFTASAKRIDGFDGEIRLDISGLPGGFSALSPLVIQEGHLEAKGTLNASLDAPSPKDTEAIASRITATGMIGTEPVTKTLTNFGKITLGAKPKLFVALEPYDENATNFVERSTSDKPLEITIVAGQTIPAWLKIKRKGHDDLVNFSVESLPHGVIVDNIGLNGVLIPKGENSRRIFLTAAKWVPEVDRLCFALARDAGSPTSLPVMLHVRRKAPALSSASH